MGLILKLLLLLIVLRALWSIIAGVIEGITGERPGKRRVARGTALVRDPVCGTFVVPSRALSARAAGQVEYFCSERCRDRYASGERSAS